MYFFLNTILFILFIYGCVGSSFLCEGSPQLWQAGATPHCGARGAPHHCGLSRCGAQAPDAQAQQLWLTGPAAPRHAGSSQTRARTRVPCIGRQTPNHCATREARYVFLKLTIFNFFFFFAFNLYTIGFLSSTVTDYGINSWRVKKKLYTQFFGGEIVNFTKFRISSKCLQFSTKIKLFLKVYIDIFSLILK